VAALPHSYVDRLFGVLRTGAGGGLDTLYNRARDREDSASLRRGGQLAEAIRDIDRHSDTEVVTIGIGINDRDTCGGTHPSWHLRTCRFAANFNKSLAGLQTALDHDRGDEALVAMTYYNPASGTGTAQEQAWDNGLLGTDLQLSCAPSGDPRLGLNDRIACIASRHRAGVADVYSAFKVGGQALISDGLHPSSKGQAVIARQFSHVLRVPSP
jgi:lysophospholipase L1-like esterase